MTDVLWTLLGAAAGAVLSFLSERAYQHFVALRRPTGLYGEWKSTWQPSMAPGWDWVDEDVVIRKSWGRITIRGRNNSGGFAWQGNGRLVNDCFLFGDWKSVKAGAQASGAFLLVYGYEGAYMCGYFFRSDTPDAKLISGFVLGRTDDDLLAGKQRLQQARVVFPREK